MFDEYTREYKVKHPRTRSSIQNIYLLLSRYVCGEEWACDRMMYSSRGIDTIHKHM